MNCDAKCLISSIEQIIFRVINFAILQEQERLEPWNVDTIGREAFSSSRINKIGEKKPTQQTLNDEEDSKRMVSGVERIFSEKNKWAIW